MTPTSPASKILAPFLAAFIVFAGAAVYYLGTATALLEAGRDLDRIARVQQATQDAVTARVDAETALRDFLLSGEELHLAHYRDAVAASGQRLRVLEQLVIDDADDRRRLQAIRVLHDGRQRQLDLAGERRRTQGLEAAQEILFATGTRTEGENVRAQFDRLQQTLASREAAAQEKFAAAHVTLRQRLWLLLGLMGLMLAAAAGLSFRAERARAYLARRLQYEATHDSLCGLPNRRFFTQWMERSLAQARREQQKLALLWLDLDGFRRINDERGQEIGDRLLRVAAKRFRSTLRESDVLARFGADEFAILTPATATPENVAALAQRLLDALREPLLPQFGPNCTVGVSIGIALYPADGDTADQLLHAADAALQAARRAGGNRWHPAVFPAVAAPAVDSPSPPVS